MSYELTNAEKELMEIFRYYKITKGNGLDTRHILTMGDEYLSPPNMKKWSEIMSSLLEKGYVQQGKGILPYILTEKGENYLYED